MGVHVCVCVCVCVVCGRGLERGRNGTIVYMYSTHHKRSGMSYFLRICAQLHVTYAFYKDMSTLYTLPTNTTIPP